MAGGAGCEWYFGYKFAHNDLNCEDWRSRSNMWRQTRIALEFFHSHLPFTEMQHADPLSSAGYCFAKPGYVYAVYLPSGGSGQLSIPAARYRVHWYNPREGGDLADGSVTAVAGPGMKPLGEPPAEKSKDWVALVTLDGPAPEKIDPIPTAASRPAVSAGDLKVSSFTLIDAEKNRPIAGYEQIKGDVTLSPNKLGTNQLNLVANVSGGRAASVRFALDNDRNFRTENEAPFALGGDQNGRFDTWQPKPGTHTVTATPYTGRNAGGEAGKALTVRLSIAN
jgi:hypothetical protein